MSVTECRARTTVADVERSLSGWGRTATSRCRVYRPRDVEDVLGVLSEGARGGTGVIARGAGCSYGDAAQNEGGAVLDMSTYDGILAIDPERRLVTAQAGARIADLMVGLAEHELTLPVVPGTRHVTLAGAIASDIHGKNHHRDGAFARHVTSISLCTPASGLMVVSPEADADLFYATLGGMGLTGVIVEATLRAEELPSPWVAADVDRTNGLQQTLELLSGPERHRYSVAWLDMLAEGSKMGRGVISRADPLPARDAPSRPRPWPRGKTYPATLSQGAAFDVPRAFPPTLLRPASVRAFNALNWRKSPRRERGRPLALAPYFFPLDVLGQWNRLYGSGGLIQYQFVIPSGQEAVLQRSFELMRMRRLPVYLAVFKRFGAAFGGPLSFPLQGWTLAIDLPGAAPGLRSALDELDELVASCGGRVYLTKDARLSRAALLSMYPRLHEFDTLRCRVDPDGVLRSDLARRLGLCGDPR
jgi:decaprenylphospho-beta-D-ribofuranose 2-oxidase